MYLLDADRNDLVLMGLVLPYNRMAAFPEAGFSALSVSPRAGWSFFNGASAPASLDVRWQHDGGAIISAADIALHHSPDGLLMEAKLPASRLGLFLADRAAEGDLRASTAFDVIATEDSRDGKTVTKLALAHIALAHEGRFDGTAVWRSDADPHRLHPDVAAVRAAALPIFRRSAEAAVQ